MKIVAALGGLLFACFAALADDSPATGDMVIVPGGSFAMGSNDGQNDERPVHQVYVAQFHIDRLPVTNARFAEFLNVAGPANGKGERIFDDDDADARIHRQGARWVADKGFE
ncbi:MAG: SUMF1/EgtB/PvdO family nonheme iron enzyme, partial [Proteobacteria bacterium]|nr:SUMF1/EgtB/PvdO family nonheme iron enzyme [Pseudomonadota bacterium]